MAKYKKRADGRYCANVQIGYDGGTGKRKYKTIYAKTIAELEQKKAEILIQREQGTVIDNKSVTVSEWSLKWLETYKSNKAYTTYALYQSILKNHIVPEIGHIKLKDLKQLDAQRLINSRADKKRLCEQIKLTLNQIINTAIDNNLLNKNVCKNIELPNNQKVEKRSLTKEEIQQIKNADLSIKERAFITVLLCAGLRRGEALALNKDDIDTKNQIININKAVYHDNKGAAHLKEPKTKTSARKVIISFYANEILKNYLETLDGEYLFTLATKKDTLMRRKSFTRFFDTIKDKVNIKDLTSHMLRHTYATNLYYAGVDIKQAQQLLGHSNVKITLDIYTHLQTNEQDIIDKLNKLY